MPRQDRVIIDTNFTLKRADGMTLSFGENGLFPIVSHNGLGIGNIKKDVSERAGEDGSVFLGMRIIDRLYEITIRWDNASQRAAFVNFFTPRKSMDFELEFNGAKYFGQCFLDDKYSFDYDGNLYRGSEINFALWFPDPYLYTETQYKYQIGYELVPLFKYPIGPEEVEEGKYVFSYIKEAQSYTIINNNPTENGIEVIIRALGPILNPKIENITTGVSTKFELQMQSDDVLYLNTQSAFVEAKLNGADVLYRLAIGAEMIQVISGKNIILFSADAGANNSSVEVSFRGRIPAL